MLMQRAMNVVHEELAAIFFGPIVALINHQAGVRMAAARGAGAAVAGVRPLIAGPMNMIGNGFDVVVNVRIEMRAGLALVTAALNHVEQMRNDAGFDDALAVLVEIDAPRIAGAFGKQFEHMLGRMITPDAGVDARAFAVRRAGLADVRMREHAVAAIKPAVRSPGESVQRFVRVLISPTIEQNLRWPGGLWFIAIFDRE